MGVKEEMPQEEKEAFSEGKEEMKIKEIADGDQGVWEGGMERIRKEAA